MSTPHDSGTLAHAILDNFSSGRNIVASLILLEHLVSRGDVDLQMPWGVKRQRNQPFDATLGQALMWGVSVNHYAPQFYRGETATRLFELDNEIFSSRTPEGEWWFWSLLGYWSATDAPARSGFDSASPGGADAWAVRVIEALPQAALEGPDAKDRWSLLLYMGLERAAGAFAHRNPGIWGARDTRGALLLRKAKGANAWAELVESGLDPFAPLPGATDKDAKALWREVLPQSSRTAPEAGSFREAVEAWLTEQASAGHPEKEEILGHKMKWISAWLTARPTGPTSPPSQSRATKAWNEVMRVLEQQPLEWLSRREPHVGWAQPFLSHTPGQPKRWAGALRENQKWLSEAGPACAIAAALFDTPFLDRVPESLVRRFSQSPHRIQDKQALMELAERKVWGNRSPSAAKMEAFLGAWEMEEELPSSPDEPLSSSPAKSRF